MLYQLSYKEQSKYFLKVAFFNLKKSQCFLCLYSYHLLHRFNIICTCVAVKGGSIFRRSTFIFPNAQCTSSGASLLIWRPLNWPISLNPIVFPYCTVHYFLYVVSLQKGALQLSRVYTPSSGTANFAATFHIQYSVHYI